MNYHNGLFNHSVHASATEGYNPPKSVADQLVGAALGKIPGAQSLLNKLNNPPKMLDLLNGLVPHEYHSNGTLQFGGFG